MSSACASDVVYAQDLSVEDDDSICANDDGITLRCLILRCDCGRFTAGQSLDESRRRDLFCNVFIRVADLGPKRVGRAY